MNCRLPNVFPQFLILTTLCAATLLAGCGDKKKTGTNPTQVAAKVNKAEISVHQINYLLQRQGNLKPEQVPAASRKILDGLVEQELAAQAAEEQKLDRDPRIVLAVEQAKRDVIARAYLEKLGGAAVKPNEDELTRYYNEHPALFSQRKVYTLRELNVEAPPAMVAEVAQKAKSAKSDDLLAVLKSTNVKHAVRQVVQPAENLPFDLLDRLATAPTGTAVTTPTPKGLNIIYLAATKLAPVTEDQARGAIESFLLNERRRKLVQQGMKSLKTAAKITYLGQFADSAAVDAAAAQASAPAFGTAASDALDASSLQKGLKGLK